MAARRRGLVFLHNDRVVNGLAAADQPQPPPRYECPSPSPQEIIKVKGLLLKIFPLEIVDTIIEHAEYWACITVSTGGRTTTVGGYGTPEDALIVSIRTSLMNLHFRHSARV
jgi:hypothetical protein